MKLYPHQAKGLEETKELNKVAYYYDMGLGKTFVGSEKMVQLGAKRNLVICQKSKIDDWVQHFADNYENVAVFDLTNKRQFECFMNWATSKPPAKASTINCVGVINYELAFRRKELAQLSNFTLMLDESSLIQNEQAKRSKFILNKLNPANIILLSGTPTGGKYENLWSQLHLLGWKISKDLYWKQYVDYHYDDNEGFPIKIIDGYKNVDRLKQKMRDYGCRFLKTEEVFELPEQVFQQVKVEPIKQYKKFHRNGIIELDGAEIVGDTILTKMLYERQLCGSYNENKLKALKDILESTDDRLIIFYNFNHELYKIEDLCIELDKPMSIVNGKTKDLSMYDEYSNAVTCVQYQAGSMGLNLQKANKIVYFTPPLSSELYEQSKKRTHRIGQDRSCFYYTLVCTGTIEEKIYATLEMRKDFTDELFKEMDV